MASAAVYRPAEALWRSLRLPADVLTQALRLGENPDPIVDSSFKIGTAAQTAIGLSGLAAAHFHQLRSGVEQTVTVDPRYAALEFKSEGYYAIEGQSTDMPVLFDDLAGVYRTQDDSYVRIHTNFPHHKQGILDILQCAPTMSAVAEAMLRWNAVDFETEAASRKMVATALRSFEQWDAHPQGRALADADTPPVMLVKVGDAPKRGTTGAAAHNGSYKRPLDGIRVLDLTRVLAGPVCGRTLAAHGADVLWITSPNLPALPPLDIDTSRGKRTTQLDLSADADRETFASLVRGADVFLQAYRPGGLTNKGFGVDRVAAMRPGIVYASLNAYGWEGPWKDRRGFDSLVQTATGFNVAEAEAYAAFERASQAEHAAPAEPHALGGGLEPRVLPMQALDHAAGYMLAFGIQAALCKTVTEGGSWEVRVSLAAVGRWIRSLGRVDPVIAFRDGRPLPRSLQDPEVVRLTERIEEAETERHVPGKARRAMRAVKHAAVLSNTPVKEGVAPMRLDGYSPVWLDRG